MRHPRRRGRRQESHVLAAQQTPSEAFHLDAPTLSPVTSDKQLDIEEAWLAEMIQTWQDEEWQPQSNHRGLGEAVGRAYREIRSSGDNDIGSILLAIATNLETYNFHDTFTGNFEVANKAIELLMSNDGQEVCCQGADDTRRLETLGTAKSRQEEADAAE